MITSIILIVLYIAFVAISIQNYRQNTRLVRLYEKELKYVSDWLISKLDSERHHKYKRCIDTAKECGAMKSYFNESGFLDAYANERMAFYERWRKRWYKIAENYAPRK